MRILLLSAALCVHDARPRFTARTLAALGHDVTLVCRGGPGLPAKEALGGASLLRVDLDDLQPLNAARSLGSFQKALVRAAGGLRHRFLRRRWTILARTCELVAEFWSLAAHAEAFVAASDGPPDAVHAVGLPALPAAGRLAAANGACLIYDAVELERDRNANYARVFRWLRLRLEAAWIGKAAGIATPSDEIGLQLLRDYDCVRPKTVLNAAPPINADTDTSTDVRGVLGLPDNAPLAVYIGAAVKDRGIGPAIQAIGRLPGFHLGVVGPDPEAFDRQFRALIKAEGAEGRVHSLPPRRPAEVTPFIQTADVAVSVVEPVCASYAFALPNKLFQPAAAGLPVVVGRTPAMRRVVRLSGIGESVDERDAAALAAAVQRQASRRGSAEFRAARAKFLAGCDHATVTSAWAAIYAQAQSREYGRK